MGVGKPIFTGKNKGDIRGVNFVDVNGECVFLASNRKPIHI
jgi:hypothetical protein